MNNKLWSIFINIHVNSVAVHAHDTPHFTFDRPPIKSICFCYLLHIDCIFFVCIQNQTTSISNSSIEDLAMLLIRQIKFMLWLNIKRNSFVSLHRIDLDAYDDRTSASSQIKRIKLKMICLGNTKLRATWSMYNPKKHWMSDQIRLEPTKLYSQLYCACSGRKHGSLTHRFSY